MDAQDKEQLNLVIVGHVDHGKSTVIGRLLADTNSLPDGKLEQVKKVCEINSKPFEYAFLLDALKDEQSQGITIDSARVFFKTDKRHYIIIDAPGHIEFLKNMITGAARAEAALLVIDADEGVQENSRRHGYMLGMLGIKQVAVLVNKMDLANYDEATFEKIKAEYSSFLNEIDVTAQAFIPISAREGENMVEKSTKMPWHQGHSVLEQVDHFKKEQKKEEKTLRFPVQDVYKFTSEGDDRRIVAGTIATGSISVGDELIFLPSQKTSKVASIEGFNLPEQNTITPGYATGITLDTQIFIKSGEIACKLSSPAEVTTRFKAHLFWLGKRPMSSDRNYKLKIATTSTGASLKEIISVLNASELSSSTTKSQIDRHDVAEIIIETQKPIACDVSSDIEATGRFVIIDGYEIAGGGIITEVLSSQNTDINPDIQEREKIEQERDFYKEQVDQLSMEVEALKRQLAQLQAQE